MPEANQFSPSTRLALVVVMFSLLLGCRPGISSTRVAPAGPQDQTLTPSAAALTAPAGPQDQTPTPFAAAVTAPALPTPTQSASTPQTTVPAPGEQPVQLLPLSGAIAESKAELSGLAWYADALIFLPQYPERLSRQADGALFALPRQAILDAVNKTNSEPLAPVEIPFYSDGVERQIDGFEGYEAIGFAGNRIYLTIEAGGSQMRGYLVSGEIAPDLSEVRLDRSTLVENLPQVNLSNKSDEAIVVLGDQLITLFEINGAGLNPDPHATHFDAQFQRLGEIPFEPLEFRVTDATPPDAEGLFWVINYFFPGEPEQATENDPLAKRFGQGASHSRLLVVERLVELRYRPEAIELSGRPPIQLELISNSQARNWEGIARMDNLGFLLVTDKFPDTLFGFVAFP